VLREGGSEVKPASQETDPAVLVLVSRLGRNASFSDKEKDEASRRNRFSPETFKPFMPRLSESEGFSFLNGTARRSCLEN
jgi:hypothetical protein